MKDRLKKIRKSLDMTQLKFAERIGVKQNTVAQYEIGRNEPIDSVITLICREFNVNETWLRTGEGEMFLEVSKDEEIASFVGRIQMEDKINFKKRFVSALAKLDEDEWEVLEKLVLEMCKEKD